MSGTLFLFYLNPQSIVEASITERQEGTFLGSIVCSADQLHPIMTAMQAACDLTAIQLVNKMMTYQPDPENDQAWEEGLEELNRRLCQCDETHQQHLDTCPLSKSKTWN